MDQNESLLHSIPIELCYMIFSWISFKEMLKYGTFFVCKSFNIAFDQKIGIIEIKNVIDEEYLQQRRKHIIKTEPKCILELAYKYSILPTNKFKCWDNTFDWFEDKFRTYLNIFFMEWIYPNGDKMIDIFGFDIINIITADFDEFVITEPIEKIYDESINNTIHVDINKLAKKLFDFDFCDNLVFFNKIQKSSLEFGMKELILYFVTVKFSEWISIKTLCCDITDVPMLLYILGKMKTKCDIGIKDFFTIRFHLDLIKK